MIIELANLLVVAGHYLETTGDPTLAKSVLIEAAVILDDFDEDIAEFLRITGYKA